MRVKFLQTLDNRFERIEAAPVVVVHPVEALPMAAKDSRVASVDDVLRLLADWPIGSRMTISIIRRRERLDIEVEPIEAESIER